MLRLFVFLLTACGAVAPAWAQLTPDQRVLDFQTLAGLYAKRYAPAGWKSSALAVNIFDVKPWLDRARSAPTDLDFYQICAEYVAQFHARRDPEAPCAVELKLKRSRRSTNGATM